MVLNFLRKTINNGITDEKTKKHLKKPNPKHLMTGTAIFISAILVISGTNIKAAFADEIRDGIADNVDSASITLAPGQTTFQLAYRIVPNNQPTGDPNGCDVDSTHKATITITASKLTPDKSSFQLGQCGSPTPDSIVTYTVSGTGTGSISVAASGGVDGSLYDVSKAALTVNIPQTDTTKPVVTVPPDQVVEATGSGGKVVTFSASALDDGKALTPTCTPASGSTFPLGTTTVTCSATDGAGNTGSNSFTITVQDKTGPIFSNVPASMTAEATSSEGAVVTYPTPTATDAVDGDRLVKCVPESGSTFPLGPTTVTCSASDTRNNLNTAAFIVTVQDTTPPGFSEVKDLTAEAENQDGAVVSYTSPTATDLVDGTITDVACKPASGSTFSLGSTTVTCSATDAAGNTGSTSFNVKVQDTTPPTMTLPSNLVYSATSATTTQVSYFSTLKSTQGFSVSDTVTPTDEIEVSCEPGDNSQFTIGTNEVTCTARDAAGNEASDTFDLRIIYPQFSWRPPTDPTGPNAFKLSSSIPAKFFLGINGVAVGEKTNIPFAITKIDSKPDSPTNEIVYTQPADTGKFYRWDSTAQQYIFVASTKALNLSTGTWKISAQLDDGTLRSVYVDINR